MDIGLSDIWGISTETAVFWISVGVWMREDLYSFATNKAVPPLACILLGWSCLNIEYLDNLTEEYE